MVQQGNESLEDEECSGRPSEADNDRLRAVAEADPQPKQEVAEELNVDHSTVIWHVKETGKVKKLGKWEPRELTKNKKIVILKCHLLSSTKQQRTSSQLDWGVLPILLDGFPTGRVRQPLS